MAKKFKNTYIDIELENGETVKATLAYIHLLHLKNHNKAAYDRYNQIMTKGPQDELDSVYILYVAYLCALVADGSFDEAMSEEEFLSVMSPDRDYAGELLTKLINPKKATASADRS